jgi:hypothetical protein
MQGSAVAAGDFAYEVTIHAEADGHRGTLRFVAPTPSESLREVRDRDCRGVVRALAFIAALLADPDLATLSGAGPAQSVPEHGSPGSPPAPPAAPAQPAIPKQPVSRAIGASPRARGPDIAPQQGRDPPTTVARADSSKVHAGFSAGVTAETALEPELGFGPRLGLLARKGALLGALSLTFGSSDRLAGSIGTAQLSWFRGRLEGCSALTISPRLELHGCGTFDGGLLEGTGRGAPLTDTRRAVWLAPGALGRLSLAIGQGLELSAELGGFVPLVRPRFLIETSQGKELVHAVPLIGISAGLGLLLYVL